MTGRYVSRETLKGWQKIIDDLKKENGKQKRRIDWLVEEYDRLNKENARLRRNDRMKYLLRKEAVAGLDKAELRELTKLMIEGEEE